MQQEIKLDPLTATSSFSQWINKNFKFLPPTFITLVLLVGQITYGILDSYLNVVVAIATCIIAEIILARVLLGKWKNIASAYMTGTSVAMLIRSTVAWPYFFTALLSILSKYVLRYKGKHLWNPSDFGITWMLAMQSPSVAGLSIQWGSNLAAVSVIWFLGLIVVNRAKRLHVTIAYVISFIALAYVRCLITGDAFLAELAPLTGPMYQLYIFLMITDPPTSVSTRKGRILVAILVALVEFIFRLNNFIYAPFYALFIVGPLTKFIDLKWFDKTVVK